MGNTLHVSLLGGFSLAWPDRDGPGVVTDQGRASQPFWAFLAYLCVNHQKPVGEEELLRALWGEGRVVDPAGTLSSLLHRSRAVLEELGFPNGGSVLLCRQGLFSWVPGLELRLDVEELDRLCAAFAADPDGALPAVLEFLSHSPGEFLPNAGKYPWTVPLRAHCRDCYFRLLRGAALRLGELERREEAVRLCRTALSLEPCDEQSHILLMRLLHASGSTQSALWHYKSASNLYRERLGAPPPPALEACYREIAQAGRTQEQDLQSIRRQLAEKDALTRPLYCDYAVFQAIYHWTARSMPRSGSIAQLALLTVTGRGGMSLPAVQCAAAMSSLRSAGLSNLREGDVCTQLSPGQYLLLLPSATQEDARTTLTRCLSAFEKTQIGRAVCVQTGVQPVLPMEL